MSSRHPEWEEFADDRPESAVKIINDATEGYDFELYDAICREADRGEKWAMFLVDRINKSVEASIDLNPLPQHGDGLRRIA